MKVKISKEIVQGEGASPDLAQDGGSEQGQYEKMCEILDEFYSECNSDNCDFYDYFYAAIDAAEGFSCDEDEPQIAYYDKQKKEFRRVYFKENYWSYEIIDAAEYFRLAMKMFLGLDEIETLKEACYLADLTCEASKISNECFAVYVHDFNKKIEVCETIHGWQAKEVKD